MSELTPDRVGGAKQSNPPQHGWFVANTLIESDSRNYVPAYGSWESIFQGRKRVVAATEKSNLLYFEEVNRALRLLLSRTCA